MGKWEPTQLEIDFRDFRANVITAQYLFGKLEGLKSDEFENFKNLKHIDAGGELFCCKYILFIIQDCKLSKVDEDRILAALGFLSGYEDIGIGERHKVYCRNVGICTQKIDMPLDEYWGNNIDKNLNDKENRIIRKLAKNLEKRMNQNSGKIGYMEDDCIISKIKVLAYPRPHYLSEDGYRKCEKNGKVFYVPIKRVEISSSTNIVEPKCQLETRLELDAEQKTDLNTHQSDNLIGFTAPISPPLVPGWGDSSGGRLSYTVAQVNGGILGSRIVFNSIIDGVIGNEKNFVDIREDDGTYAGQNNKWHSNYISVENEKVYLIRLYIHNDNPDEKDAIAKEVMAAISLPVNSAKELQIRGHIRAKNANPKRYWASVIMRSNTAPFHLEYVKGSAWLEGNHVNHSSRMHQLSDRIVADAPSGGVLIDADYDTRDGRVPGTFDYACYVTIRVKAVFDHTIEDDDFSFVLQARLENTKNWSEHKIEVQAGDIIEFGMIYTNNGTNEAAHCDVAIGILLPESLEYISGSTILYNVRFKDGKKISNDGIISPDALIIGDYNPMSNAFVRFKAKAIGNNVLSTHICRAQCCVGRISHIEDIAVVIEKQVAR